MVASGAGSIPRALGTAPNLETLDVKSNHLSVLPDEWVLGYPSVVNSSLVNVRTSFNNFSGSFPAALAQAPDLTFLVINNNTLRWDLPSYLRLLCNRSAAHPGALTPPMYMRLPQQHHEMA